MFFSTHKLNHGRKLAEDIQLLVMNWKYVLQKHDDYAVKMCAFELGNIYKNRYSALTHSQIILIPVAPDKLLNGLRK